MSVDAPKMGGLSDPRLGTMDRALKCTTDGAGQLDCPGYFGHIELAKPMFHVGYIKTVLKILRCVSYYNSRLLLEPVRFIHSSCFNFLFTAVQKWTTSACCWSQCALYSFLPTSAYLPVCGQKRAIKAHNALPALMPNSKLLPTAVDSAGSS